MTIDTSNSIDETKTGKDLYAYQKGAINKIFTAFDDAPEDYHLLYQLPTGGGKTVIFSEIVRQYLKNHNKRVLIMTHRIELLTQTSKMLTEFGVINKVVNSTANLDDQDQYSCFVAMVETLNNRLQDEKFDISNIGLVIIDEEHRFGVRQKENLKAFRANVDVLTLTATPIPRTLSMAMD